MTMTYHKEHQSARAAMRAEHRVTELIDAAGGVAQRHIWEGMTHVFLLPT